MSLPDIKSIVTVKGLISIATLVGTLISGWIFIDSRYAHAEDVERTVAQIAIDAQASLLEFRLQTITRNINEIKRKRMINGGLDREDMEDIEELRKEKAYLKARRDKLHDASIELQNKVR